MSSALVDPGLLASLPEGLFPSRCTIQTPTQARDGFGDDKAPGTWADLADHVAIPCRMAPQGGVEERPTGLIFSRETKRVALRGSFPTITAKQRAVIDGTAFDILAVESDSEGVLTYLRVEQIT